MPFYPLKAIKSKISISNNIKPKINKNYESLHQNSI